MSNAKDLIIGSSFYVADGGTCPQDGQWVSFFDGGHTVIYRQKGEQMPGSNDNYPTVWIELKGMRTPKSAISRWLKRFVFATN